MTVVRVRAASSERRIEISRLRDDMAQLRSQRAGLEQFFSDPSTRMVTRQAAFLNTLIDERSFPWTQFFLDLEHVLPGGVRILALSPSLSGDHLQVKMRVGALSDKSKLDFLQALEDAPEFSGLRLNAETRPGKGEGADVVELELVADYRTVAQSEVARHSPSAPAGELRSAERASPPSRQKARSLPLRDPAPPNPSDSAIVELPKPAPSAPAAAFQLPSISPGRALEDSVRGTAGRGDTPPATFGGALPRGGAMLREGAMPHGGAGAGYAGGAVQLLTPDQGVDFSGYLNQVVASVRREWYSIMPESAKTGDRGRVVIDFKIARDGSVLPPEPLLRLTSGEEPLDNAAMGSIRGASPFPPLPSDYSGPYIELRFTFRYNLPQDPAP